MQGAAGDRIYITLFYYVFSRLFAAHGRAFAPIARRDQPVNAWETGDFKTVALKDACLKRLKHKSRAGKPLLLGLHLA